MNSITSTYQHQKHYPLKLSLNMESTTEKEDRKREYNRLAQREFRRRRKEHMKSLEQAQKELSSERAEEIERLRLQNEELKKENSALRAQIYNSTSTIPQLLSTAPSFDNRQFSLSPSVSGTSMSRTESPPSLMGSDYLPMGNFAVSPSMMGNSLQTYPDQDMSGQPYSMVLYPGIRHNTQCSPESSGYRTSRNSMDSSSLKPIKNEVSATFPGLTQRQVNSLPALTMNIPYDRSRARFELCEMFRPLITDRSICNDPQRHFAVLQSITNVLPLSLKPTKRQLETAHYHGIDMIASPSLRDRLLSLKYDMAYSFVNELGIINPKSEDTNALTIWGDDPLNEMYWELSKAFLERWGWVVGNEWIQRSNFWRNIRGHSPLPEW
ncbi:putative transcription factor bzip [Erysiphe neolycopersici]|uniref:Putative transcription factor bzip n=1 Tax=Erysiphe neolycopersici TaxID=212602 RepID=A0A420I2T9_9PEZI|nr:putative transcription factor bzip [Erysiphe neolycopersici]